MLYASATAFGFEVAVLYVLLRVESLYRLIELSYQVIERHLDWLYALFVCSRRVRTGG